MTVGNPWHPVPSHDTTNTAKPLTRQICMHGWSSTQHETLILMQTCQAVIPSFCDPWELTHGFPQGYAHTLETIPE
jgi:hypothetical protein